MTPLNAKGVVPGRTLIRAFKTWLHAYCFKGFRGHQTPVVRRGYVAAAPDLTAIWSDLKARYDDAIARGDDRDTGRLGMQLRQAQTERLRAEVGL